MEINDKRIKPLAPIFICMLFLYACHEIHTERYFKDKEHIEKAFISNEEASKQFLNYYEDGSRPFHVKEIPPTSTYPYTIYNKGFSYYRNMDGYKFATKVPVGNYIDVEVGYISYSPDSLKCVALIIVGDHRGDSKIDIDSLSNCNEDLETLYNGYAYLGIRDSKYDDFKIYPMDVFGVFQFSSRSQALTTMKLNYIYWLSGSSPIFAPRKYTCGINNPKFFETAPEFVWVDSLNLYWGQCEARYKKLKPYVFYSNQDSTMHKYIGLKDTSLNHF